MCSIQTALDYQQTCTVTPNRQLDIQNIANHDQIRYFYWIHTLRNLSSELRLIFGILVGLIFVFAFIGNLVTIIANVRRRQRVLFKVSLISLALSDILLVTFTSTTYISQFSSEFTSLWVLGSEMCLITPFIQTTALLVNSITLVAIALDRYIAVGKILKRAWDPSMLWCMVTASFLWGVSFGISTPMLTLYEQYKVLILIPDPNNSTVPIDYSIAQVCATNKTESLQYFVFIFVFIFIPLLVAFLWLNIVIAKEIWDRRHPVVISGPPTRSVTADKRTGESNTTKNASSVSGAVTSEKPQKSFGSNSRAQYSTSTAAGTKVMPWNPRKQRQLRMVKVIVVIMTIFLICRLPNWAFLLVKLKVQLVGTIYWIIHYILGILSMASCLLNPFVYTFLSETIQFTTFMGNVCRRLCFWKCGSQKAGADKVPNTFRNLCDHGDVYLGDNK